MSYNIEEIQRLRLKPGDIVVIKHRGHLTENSAVQLRTSIRKLLITHGLDNEVLVLDSTVDLEILERLP